MTSSAALVVGVGAGLAVAVPLGAVGTLVLDTGLRHGTRPALAAGLGVATVDGLYAAAAALAGASVATALAPAQSAIRLVAAGVLAVVALALLRGALRPRRAGAPAAPAPAPGRLYRRFVALTALNPTTAATFAAVTAGLPAAHGDDLGPGPAAAFVVGALAASTAWHAGLATTAGTAGRRLGPGARRWTRALGAVLALALAARLALN